MKKKVFTQKYSPLFQEFVIDTYRYIRKWSGRDIAKALDEHPQALDYHADKEKHDRNK